MKKWIFLIAVISFQLQAQDTIRFVDGKVSAVKVNEIGLKEIKYARADNVNGPLYIVDKNEIYFIKYANGSVDSFNVKKSNVVNTATNAVNTTTTAVVETTPAYVDSKPVEPSFEKINIIRKRLYYQHHGLNERGLLELIGDYPDTKAKTIMLREFSKIRIYKNNRLIGLTILGIGVLAQLNAMGSRAPSAGTVFLAGAAAGITGCVIATINKNKRYAKRVEIAKIYNGESVPGVRKKNRQ